jgi:hypothetical protein
LQQVEPLVGLLAGDLRADQARQTQDAMQGGSHFMAHGGQKATLGHAQLLGLVQGLSTGLGNVVALEAKVQQLAQASVRALRLHQQDAHETQHAGDTEQAISIGQIGRKGRA